MGISIKRKVSFEVTSHEGDGYNTPEVVTIPYTIELETNKLLCKDIDGKEVFRMNEYEIKNFVLLVKAFYHIK